MFPVHTLLVFAFLFLLSYYVYVYIWSEYTILLGTIPIEEEPFTMAIYPIGVEYSFWLHIWVK